MKRLELHDEDGDRIVVSDFNDDVPVSAREPSTHTEAKLTVHQHTIMDDPATDLSDIAEDGVSVLLTPGSAAELIAWLSQFFEAVVALSAEEARALRAHLKGHTVADTTRQLELLAAIQARLDEAVG